MKKLFLLALNFLIFSAYAQNEPSWSQSFDSPVVWQRVTSLGQLIVHSGGSLIGINTENGEKMWQVPNLGNLNESGFEELGKSNFFTITSTTDGNQVMLINSLNGKILIDTKERGISNILSSDLLSRLGIILMVVEKEGQNQASLIAFDINTGVTKWTNDELFKVEMGDLGLGNSKLSGLLGKMAQTAANDANKIGLLAPPIALDDKSLLLLHPNFTYCVNPYTGEKLWSIPNEGGAIRASANTTSRQPGTVFIGIEKEMSQTGSFSSFSTSSGDTGPATMYELNAIDIASGKSKWKSPYVEKNASLSTMILAENGVILSPPSSSGKVSLNMVDYVTGAGLWGKKGKGNGIKGSIVGHKEFDGGWLVTLSYDNAWNNAGEEYYVNVLNPDGIMRYDKNVKLKGDLKSVQLLDKGLLYITNKEVNILNLSTGDQMFDSPEAASPLDASKYDPLKHSLAYVDQGDKMYVFSSKNDMLYEINKITASIKEIGEKIKFEGRESPYILETDEEGIVLSAEQNVTKISYDGSLIYQTYYPAPRQPGVLRALAAAQALRAAYIGAAAAAYSAAFDQAAENSDNELGQQVGNELAQGFGELSRQGFSYSKDAMAYATTRFKASANAPEYKLILTDTGRKEYSLVQVSKKTGEKIGMIDLGNDKEPNYDLDEIYGRLYYLSEPDRIVCYQF